LNLTEAYTETICTSVYF